MEENKNLKSEINNFLKKLQVVTLASNSYIKQSEVLRLDKRTGSQLKTQLNIRRKELVDDLFDLECLSVRLDKEMELINAKYLISKKLIKKSFKRKILHIDNEPEQIANVSFSGQSFGPKASQASLNMGIEPLIPSFISKDNEMLVESIQINKNPEITMNEETSPQIFRTDAPLDIEKDKENIKVSLKEKLNSIPIVKSESLGKMAKKAGKRNPELPTTKVEASQTHFHEGFYNGLLGRMPEQIEPIARVDTPSIPVNTASIPVNSINTPSIPVDASSITVNVVSANAQYIPANTSFVSVNAPSIPVSSPFVPLNVPVVPVNRISEMANNYSEHIQTTHVLSKDDIESDESEEDSIFMKTPKENLEAREVHQKIPSKLNPTINDKMGTKFLLQILSEKNSSNTTPIKSPDRKTANKAPHYNSKAVKNTEELSKDWLIHNVK